MCLAARNSLLGINRIVEGAARCTVFAWPESTFLTHRLPSGRGFTTWFFCALASTLTLRPGHHVLYTHAWVTNKGLDQPFSGGGTTMNCQNSPFLRRIIGKNFEWILPHRCLGIRAAISKAWVSWGSTLPHIVSKLCEKCPKLCQSYSEMSFNWVVKMLFAWAT